MSKITLTPNASGTGTFTLASPNSNTNRTLTLPDSAGELLTATGDGSGLTSLTSANLTGALPAIDGSSLTSLTSANLTGSLPAIDGAALTGITSPVKAWVNFNGTGTVAIRASFNVSSITDEGTGKYQVNFTTAFADTNYATVGTCGDLVTGQSNVNLEANNKPGNILTTSVRVNTVAMSNAYADCEFVNVIITR